MCTPSTQAARGHIRTGAGCGVYSHEKILSVCKGPRNWGEEGSAGLTLKSSKILASNAASDPDHWFSIAPQWEQMLRDPGLINLKLLARSMPNRGRVKAG